MVVTTIFSLLIIHMGVYVCLCLFAGREMLILVKFKNGNLVVGVFLQTALTLCWAMHPHWFLLLIWE